ncbi:MAG: hypothetical protein NC419_07090 [Muribaculaceae bacterium]|nr:hypothetical protein [Muribaculaceae bacterium]
MDKEITYNFLWERVIEPQIINIAQLLKELYSVDQVYDFQIRELNEYKETLYINYMETKDILKEKFFYQGANQNADENLIDIHKISACFCKSIIENKVYRFKLIDQIPVQVLFCNYCAAFSISVGIMYVNLLAEYKQEQKIVQYNKLKDQRQFYFPPTNLGHDSYPYGRIKTLALNDIYGVDFDLLAYADMMYWIEEYNKGILAE